MALVRGEVFPDYYQVQPDSGAIAHQNLGSKTIAYRLPEKLRLSELALNQQQLPATHESPSGYVPTGSKEQLTTDNCLQTYLLSEEQQKQYALEAKYLTELIELTHRLRADLGSSLMLEWTLVQAEASLEAQLYLTQAYPRPPDTTSPNPSEEDVLTRGQGDAGNVSAQLESSSSSVTPAQTATIRGLGASSGRAMAKALLLAGTIDHPEQLPPGRILIAPSITPDWLPLLQRAAGVVAEQGA